MTTHNHPIETLEPTEVAKLLKAGKILLIDVREPSEFEAERIQGALLYPLSTFDASVLPQDGPRRVVFHCGTAKRSLVAAERRLAAGHGPTAHMAGGLVAWKAAKLPILSSGVP